MVGKSSGRSHTAKPSAMAAEGIARSGTCAQQQGPLLAGALGHALAAIGFSCIDKPLISLSFSNCQINRQVVESLAGQGFGAAGDRLSPKLSTGNRRYREKCKQIKHLRKSLWTVRVDLGTSLISTAERSQIEVMHKTGAHPGLRDDRSATRSKIR